MKPAVRLVLLDLDGTLVDSAPDLAAAANRMRIARGIEPLPISELRPFVSHGARGMVGRAFNVTVDDARYAELRQEFLREYESALCVESALVSRHGRHAATVGAARHQMGNRHQQVRAFHIAAGAGAEVFRTVRRASSAATPRSFRSHTRHPCCTRSPQRLWMPVRPCTSATISVTSTQDMQPACVP